MRALITGGAGFIGSHLAERLLSQGHEVVVLDDLSTGKRSNLPSGVNFMEGSILEPTSVTKAAEGCRCIFHVAAVASVQRSIDEPNFCIQVNVEGSLNVLEAAKRHGARIVFSSSSAVYGDASNLPIPETERTEPLSPYGVHKLTFEKLLFSYNSMFGTESICLRYFNVFGPKQDPNGEYAAVISKFVTRALRNDPLIIFGEGHQTRDFIFVEDVVDANIAAMNCQTASANCINVGVGKAWSVRELAEAVIQASKSQSQIRHESPRSGEILHSFGTVDRAKELLGFSAKTPMKQGLEKTIAYWRAQLSATAK